MSRLLALLWMMLILAPTEGRSESCYPCSIIGRSALLYLEKDETRVGGVVRRQDSGDVVVCGLSGPWARVKIGYTYYWMKTEDLRLRPTDKEVLSLALPSNVARPEAIEWCNEAVVASPTAELYVGQDKVENALTLRQGTLLLACGRLGDFVVVEYGDLTGRIEASSLKVSSAERPRGVGFKHRRLCKMFLWRGRLRQDAPLVRWEGGQVMRVATLPASVEVEVATQQGDWYWVRFAGEWGYVQASLVELVPGAHEGFDPFRAVETCLLTFRRAKTHAQADLLSGPGATEVVQKVPAGAEVFVLKEAHDYAEVQYLGRSGFIPTGVLAFQGGEEPLAQDFDPYPADESLLAPGMRGYRRDKVGGVARLSLGMAASSTLEGVAAALDAGVGAGLGPGTDLVVSFFGMEADSLLLGGPELGVDQVLAPLSRSVVLSARLSTGPHWVGGTSKALSVGWGVGAYVDAALGRGAGIGVGYTFRGEHRVRCNEGPCPEANSWFHSVACSLRVSF